jgi:hypothetical protein
MRLRDALHAALFYLTMSNVLVLLRREECRSVLLWSPGFEVLSGDMNRALLASLILSCTLALTAQADVAFTWTFVPETITTNPGSTFDLDAQLTNTGTEDLNTDLFWGATISRTLIPYLTLVGFGSPTESIAQEFTGVNLAPGQTFDFSFVWLQISPSTPDGVYQVLSGNQVLGLGNSSTGDYTGQIPSTNEVFVNVGAVPEPSAFWPLMAIAAVIGTRMLRKHTSRSSLG